VYRLSPAEGLTLAISDFVLPNGICFSPQEEYLYVSDSTRGHIRRFRHADGQLSDDTVFVTMPGVGFPTPGVPDGLKCLADGRVLSTGPGGIWLIDQAGTHIGTMPTPEVSTNLAFGGADWRTLFVTTVSAVYSLTLAVPGSMPYERPADERNA